MCCGGVYGGIEEGACAGEMTAAVEWKVADDDVQGLHGQSFEVGSAIMLFLLLMLLLLLLWLLLLLLLLLWLLLLLLLWMPASCKRRRISRRQSGEKTSSRSYLGWWRWWRSGTCGRNAS